MRIRTFAAAFAAGLIAAAPGEALGGRLDGPPGIARQKVFRVVPRFPRPPARARPRERRPPAHDLPAVKVEGPTYYDFQPEPLAPVDFRALRPASQLADDRPADAPKRQ